MLTYTRRGMAHYANFFFTAVSFFHYHSPPVFHPISSSALYSSFFSPPFPYRNRSYQLPSSDLLIPFTPHQVSSAIVSSLILRLCGALTAPPCFLLSNTFPTFASHDACWQLCGVTAALHCCADLFACCSLWQGLLFVSCWVHSV